jgi:hypothetical protein
MSVLADETGPLLLRYNPARARILDLAEELIHVQQARTLSPTLSRCGLNPVLTREVLAKQQILQTMGLDKMARRELLTTIRHIISTGTY